MADCKCYNFLQGSEVLLAWAVRYLKWEVLELWIKYLEVAVATIPSSHWQVRVAAYLLAV